MKKVNAFLVLFVMTIFHSSPVAQEIKKDQSRTIEMHKAKEIQVYKSKEVKPNSDKTGISEMTDTNAASADMSSPEAYFEVWKTRIPGGVWYTPSSVRGYDVQHVSAGAASGDLIINKDGTYVWNSYGGKKGKWEKGDKDYPVVLIDSKENKKWKVGFDPKHTGGREIAIWDGKYYYYDGKR